MTAPRPLSRGYTREPAVLAEIRAVATLRPPEFWRRAAIADYQHPETLRSETLVYTLRDFAQSGREDEAWRLAHILIERIARTVGAYLSRAYGLSRDDRDDIQDAILVQLYEHWTSAAPEHEFWEVRFNLCLRRTVIDAVEAHRRIARREVVLAPIDDDARDPLESFEDQGSLSPEDRALVAAALDSLDEPLRTAFFLRHFEQWDEESVAQHLGVTSRTVRNYLARADRALAEWRRE